MDKINLFQVGYNPTATRATNDLYCTNPKQVEKLLEYETFNNNIWECCNGLSHISNYLIDKGYTVTKTDIDTYEQDDVDVVNFLDVDTTFDGDIITNPPYHNAEQFAAKAIESANKVAMLMKINFLATQKNKKLYDKYPPKVIYVLSKRLNCAKNGEFDKYGNGAVDYCWIIWEKGYEGQTQIKWI